MSLSFEDFSSRIRKNLAEQNIRSIKTTDDELIKLFTAFSVYNEFQRDELINEVKKEKAEKKGGLVMDKRVDKEKAYELFKLVLASYRDAEMTVIHDRSVRAEDESELIQECVEFDEEMKRHLGIL